MLKTRRFNAVIALEIILSMTLYYFVLIGFTAITYAIDLVQTNNHNIDFSAYFINENGEKINSAEKSINEKEYLYVDVMVKNEGYFNGWINLNNNNFNIVQEIQSEGIEEISGNSVRLKQINSGITQTIKLLIEPIREDRINRASFNANTEVVLSGDYINSKNIQADNRSQISGSTTVQLLWKSSQDIASELEANVLTNSLYELNGEQKRIVQLLINSRVKDNEYPVNKSSIKVKGLKNVEQVKVFARNTNATNAQLIFTERNYEYDKTNNVVTINVQNDNQDVISWKKDCKDTFVVSYVLDKNEIVTNETITVNGDILTCDDKILQANAKVVVNEEKDGIVTSDLLLKENFIYKGKIYTGEERTYQIADRIYMNYSDLTNKVVVNENSSKYVQNEILLDANNIYKSTYVSKNNFINILGEEGYIIIKDEKGALIGNINNSTEPDENGNIVLNYNTEVKGLVIETSKPIKEGTLNLVHTKTIKNSGLPRETINALTGIKENSEVKYNDKNTIVSNDKIIELKNTTSKARFEVETNRLTATEKNENVKMTVVLENSHESRDLYQNPIIRIILPSQVKNISAKCKVMYNNGLELANAKINKVDNNFVLEIGLQGTQAVYNAGIVEGTSIIIYANVDIDENATNSNEEIIMNYTNELATSFEDNGEEKVGIQVEAIPEELKAKLQEAKVTAQEAQGQLNTSLKAYVGGQELSNGDIVYTGEIVRYEITLENNTNVDIENVNVQASVPEGTTLVEYVKNAKREESGEGIDVGEDSYRDLDITGNITKEVARIIKNDTKKIYYEVRIKENINLINNQVKVIYNNAEKTNTFSNNVENSKVCINIFRLARSSDDYDLDGSVIPYKLEIKNISQETLSNNNIKITTNQNYTIRNIIEKDNSSDSIEYTDENGFTINQISAGETKYYIVNVKLNKVEDYSRICAIINGKYRSNIIDESTKINRVIAKISSNSTEKLNIGDTILYNVEVENLGDFTVDGLNITQLISGYLNIEEVSINNQQVEYSIVPYYDNNINELGSQEEENQEESQGENEEESEGEDPDNTDDYVISCAYNENLNNGEKINIKVRAIVNDIKHKEDIEIKSFAQVNDENTETISNILAGIIDDDSTEPDYETPDDEYEEDPTAKEKDDKEDNPDDGKDSSPDDKPSDKDIPDDSGNNKPDSSTDGSSDVNIENRKYSISGRVWLDENQNGQRDSNEKEINDAQVTLLNVDTNKTQKTKNGSYEFKDLDKGRYIAIFEYDTNKYNLTKYQAENVSKALNSDVEKNKITYEGKEQELATTDILNLTNGDLTNIDLGLVIAKNFDLELTKTISKVTISNTEGKTVKEYNDEALAKVEIGAKYLKNSTVVIEYNIKVKNTGEMAGYAKQIVDYKPTDLKFNSSLNSSWYQSGENLYSNALEKTKIEPGETKELKLILTKEMTESNTGLTNNMAEINKSISINNTNDSDSTSGNKKSKEDDLGQANVIISVKTGAAISYIMVTLSIISVISVSAFYLNKKLEMINN